MLVKNVLVGISEEDIKPFQLFVKSYRDENAHLNTFIDVITVQGFISYLLTDSKLMKKETYRESSFKTVSINYLLNYTLILLAETSWEECVFYWQILTCFVIISGVIVWLTAREKKMYRYLATFNRNVGFIYLGDCLGLYPPIALLFVTAKSLPLAMENRFDVVNYVFFGFWLIYTGYAFWIKNYFKINQHALILTAILGMLIPVVNGFRSGGWFWNAQALGYPDLFFVDVAWIVLSSMTVLSITQAKPNL